MPSSYFLTKRSEPKTFMAVATTSVTLVGYYRRAPPPYRDGNCFSVTAGEGRHWKILNFSYENLIALLDLPGPVTWPIRCAIIDEKHRLAVIHDPRIPQEWYQQNWCRSCCPHYLLPMPQRLLGALREDRGTEVYHPPARRTSASRSGSLPSVRIAMVSTNIDPKRDQTNWFFPEIAALLPRIAAAEKDGLKVRHGRVSAGIAEGAEPKTKRGKAKLRELLPIRLELRAVMEEVYRAYRRATKLSKETVEPNRSAMMKKVRTAFDPRHMCVVGWFEHHIASSCSEGTCP